MREAHNVKYKLWCWSGLRSDTTVICKAVSSHYSRLVTSLWSRRVLLQLYTLTDVTDAIVTHIKKICAFLESCRESLALFYGLVSSPECSQRSEAACLPVLFFWTLCVWLCVKKIKLENLWVSIKFGPLINQTWRIQSSINNLEQSCVFKFLQSRLLKPKIAAVY